MLETGHILQTDLFSHTRYGSPWVNHSWLSQVILYWLFNHLSYAGLGLWMGAVVTAAFGFVHRQMEGGPFTRAFILVLAAATSAVIWSARPQLLSFLLTAAVAYLLHLFKWKRVNRLWLLPLLFVLWVNLHAGYALGFMLLAAFVGGEILNQLLASVAPGDDPIVGWRGIGLVVGVALVSVLALVVNPNTTRMWTYCLETARMDVLQDFVQEWQSPDFHPLHTQPFIWLLLTTLAAVGLSRRRVDGTDLAMVGVFAYAALLAGRNFGPFALVAGPVLSRHVAAILSRWGATAPRRDLPQAPRLGRSSTRGVVNWALLSVIVALAAVKAYHPLRPAVNEQWLRKRLPVGAAEWIETHRPQGRMFNRYEWGGYLIWRLWPDQLVFVDGRTDLYGDAFLRRYMDVQSARPGFEKTLEAHEVDIIVTNPGSALSGRLGCGEEWEEAYQDPVAVVWLRREPDP